MPPALHAWPILDNGAVSRAVLVIKILEELRTADERAQRFIPGGRVSNIVRLRNDADLRAGLGRPSVEDRSR